jgi:hypothetical protein
LDESENNDEDQKEMVDAKLHLFLHHLNPSHHHHHHRHAAAAAAVDPELGWKTKDLPDDLPDHEDPAPQPRRGAFDLGPSSIGSSTLESGSTYTLHPFRFLPTWHNLATHHIHSIGFLACTVQLIGTTIFVVTGIVALPGILENLVQWQLNAAYWIPQIVASAFFIAASLLFMLETQEKWWRFEPGVLGWWIGAWSLVGSCGFM